VDDPIVVEATRGDVIEARHRVHAVAVRGAELVLAAGVPGLATLLRSAAKPFQALPLARLCPDLPDAELAIACSSHVASEEQLAAVRSLLARAGASEDDLECGPAGDPPTPLRHNCSGKHAGMLLVCRERGWPADGYRLPGHPVQEACLREVAGAASLSPEDIAQAVDGCGVPTFALSLRDVALAFSHLRALDGGPRVANAMRAHPELLRGPVEADALLARSLDGWVAKGGAEGLLGASSPDGLGLALKVEDGSFRALRPALAEVLRRLGLAHGDLGRVSVESSRGESVGALRVAGSANLTPPE
jgi:L-asparaginase II